jgi:phosphoribosyl-ATP pyrophosphohydrolase
MNFKKWENVSVDGPNQAKLFFKLTEEVGEVGKAFNEEEQANVVEELEHVIFIAERLLVNVGRFGKEA